MIDQTHEQAVNIENQVAAQPTSQEKGGIAEKVKIQPFDGTRSKLRPFLAHLEIYFRFNTKLTRTDKCLVAAQHLQGEAAVWVQPYLTTWFSGKDAGNLTPIETERILVLKDFELFKKALTANFGITDEEATAAQKIRRIRQTRDAAGYLAEFQRLAAVLDWNDSALAGAAYDGLKEEVKDEIARLEEQPNMLSEMIKHAVHIDTRIWERHLEQKGYKQFPNHTAKRQMCRENHNPYRPQPMELDATMRSQDHEKDELHQKKLCFFCKKPGHFARNCYKKNGNQLRRKLRATKRE
ncbi:hypothetical protein AJ80_10088 [Polytolypa hystricis UAMH7299]|uniref:CCHC-type domain-containing protein n=1 Tax=Polytolypa hystricis (strain UAMH7299) TaxID=1447883 RepID=A0A2B7WEB3_POLH7|nr:hypothetical protein AJ80_10088 [Polytolypa hystricis UAMH7299]